MAWTAPMTAVANALWTAAQWNAHVRDNLAETMAGKASANSSRWFVATGANAIAERVIDSATVGTSQTTTSTSYADLATVGPAVTVTTGTKALVFTTAGTSNSGTNNATYFSYAVSSATTIAASDTWAGRLDGVVSGNANKFSSVHFVTNLNAGSNTFTMRYRVAAGTGTYYGRGITVVSF